MKAVSQIATPSPAEPAGHLKLENGRATLYLNLNHYDPNFLETAKRFFQSNGIELKVRGERIDAFGKIVSGTFELVRKSGNSAFIQAEQEDARKDGSRWVGVPSR